MYTSVDAKLEKTREIEERKKLYLIKFHPMRCLRRNILLHGVLDEEQEKKLTFFYRMFISLVTIYSNTYISLPEKRQPNVLYVNELVSFIVRV